MEPTAAVERTDVVIGIRGIAVDKKGAVGGGSEEVEALVLRPADAEQAAPAGTVGVRRPSGITAAPA